MSGVTLGLDWSRFLKKRTGNSNFVSPFIRKTEMNKLQRGVDSLKARVRKSRATDPFIEQAR
jgi:hypothetical protein